MNREPHDVNPDTDFPAEGEPVVIHGEMQGSATTETPSTVWEPVPASSVELSAAADDEPVAVSRLPGGEAERVASLDALRGLFVVAITVTFALYGDYYPTWMYHRQFPPPGEFVDIAGITWLDIPYAGFLFAAAAAIPIALSRRVKKGETEIAIVFGAVRRFFLLAVFALLIGHSNTFFTGYTQEGRLAALIGFAVMFAIFLRPRSDWNPRVVSTINTLGWIGAVVFLAVGPMIYGGNFSVEKRDQVILDIAFATLAGSILWYFTRHHLGARMAALGAIVALHLAARQTGWVQTWWWDSPAPWLLTSAQLIKLVVVIPGTVVGDLLLRWMRAPEASPATAWNAGRWVTLAIIAVAFTPLMVIGLFDRDWVGATALITLGLSLIGVLLTWAPVNSHEHLARQLFTWGALWLLLGLFFEPAEAGIKKVPDTVSYFLVMAGLSTMLLLAFIAVMDIARKRVWARSLVDVGRNPMLGYVLYSIFLNSLLELIPPFRELLRATPAQSLLRTVLSTVLVVVIVQAFTRRRVMWRT